MSNVQAVWVFNGEAAQLPSGVFPTREDGDRWICHHRLTGILTEYPLGLGVYDWAIENGFFVPKREEHASPKFIGRFSSGHLRHVHYENGYPKE